MEPNWAEENLKVIRTLMERSALYRRALAPIMLTTGAIGILAAFGSAHFAASMLRTFALYWTVICGVTITTALWISRRQALQANEAFWSAPTRKVASAIVPALVTAAFLTLFVTAAAPDEVKGRGPVLVFLWLALYGCALHSAAMFISAGMRRLAWAFIIASAAVPVLLVGESFPLMPLLSPHLLMGLTFGGFHLVAGVYLYFTEKSRNAQ
jgi:hypothetical protein